MVTKIKKWGNSQGLRFSKQMLEQAHISVGDEVEVIVKNNKIIIQPSMPIRGKHSLKDLVAKMPDDYKVSETDWGQQGKEVW